MVTALLNAVSGRGAAGALSEGVQAAVNAAAKDLKSAGKNALVLAGSNDLNVQRVVNAINEALGATGTTVKFESNDLFQGSSAALAQLTQDMAAGRVNTLIVADCNPAYDAANAAAFSAALGKVNLTVSTATVADETASQCRVIAPTHHWLESWGARQI